MKKISVLLVAALLFAAQLKSQNSWQKTYSNNTNWYGAGAVIQTLDGGFASVSTAAAPLTAGMNDVVLTKYDVNGNIQWAQIYGGTLDEEGVCVTQAANGNYYIGGSAKSFTSGAQNIYIVAADVNGTLLWSQYEPGTSGFGMVQKVEATSTNGVVVYGVWANQAAFILNYDMNGVILQNRYYDPGSAGNYKDSFGQKIAGGYITAGTDRYATNAYSQVKVVKFNNSMNPTKIKVIGPASGAYYIYAKSCMKTSTGDYLIGGNANIYGSGGDDGYITKLDSNLNMIWFRSYGDVDNNYFTEVKETSDGGCIAVGYTDLNGNAILVKTNSSGVTEWQREYDLGGAFDRAHAVWQNSDGGYIISLRTTAGKTCIIRTDMNGTAGGCNTGNWNASNVAGAPVTITETLGSLGTMTMNSAVASENSRAVTVTSLCSTPTCSVNAVYSQSASVVVDGASVTFTNASTSATTYQWFDGGTNFSSSASPTQILTTPGIHTIKLIASNGTCYDTMFSTVNVTPVVVNSNWQATYANTNGMNNPGGVVQTLDGGYAAVGYNGLTKFDANGNVQWAKSYTGTNNGYLAYLAQASDGSFYLVGNMIIKTDATGNILWSKIDSLSVGSISSIYTTPANELVIMNPWGGGTLLVTKISPTGATLSAFGVNGSGMYEAYGQQTSDGGSVHATHYGFSLNRIYIAKYTSAFAATWYREISGPGAFVPKSTQQTSDGGYIVSGYQNAYGQGGNDGFILKVTSTGTPQWFRAYGDTGDNRFFGARQTSDGGYIAGGYTGTSPNINAILVKTSSTGVVQWEMEYNLGGDEVVNSVMQTSDGGYLLGGRNNATGNVFLIKTDANGVAGGCGTTVWGGIGFSYTPTNAASSNSIITYPFIGSMFTASNSALINKTGICSQVVCSSTASASFTQPSCFGSCNGTATCTPTGTSPYSFMWSNGQTTQTATGLCAGSYTVTVTDASSCTATAVVTVTQPTSLSASSSATTPTICSGACTNINCTVSGGTSPYSYLWMPGSLTGSPSVCPTTTTTYTCTTTDANGCTQSSTVTVTVNYAPPTPGTISGALSFCAGSGSQTYTIAAVSGATSYTWSLPAGWSGSSTTNSIVATPGTSSGTISVAANNSCGPSTAQTLSVTVNPLPTVTYSQSPSIVCVNHTSVTLGSSSPSGGTYSGTAVTGSTFDASVAGVGTYSITYTYTDGNGCTNMASSNITVDPCTGIDQNSLINGVNFYPNPTNGLLTVTGIEVGVLLEVFNVIGEKIFESKSNDTSAELNLNGFQNGIYFIKINSESGVATKKIIKQ